MTDWGALRAVLDATGLTAAEQAAANGVDPEVAGRRVAEFNDMLIARLKTKERLHTDE